MSRHSFLHRIASMGLAALVGVSALTLTGCHGAKRRADFVVPEKFDEKAQIEITFWAKNDTNKTQVDIYNQAIADFEAYYPNITVNMRLYTDYSKIYNDVITNIATDTTPNVCITYPDHIATYMTGENVVVPLDDLIYDKNYGLGGALVKFDSPTASEVVSKYLNECVIGDYTYALPFMRSTEACYINKTYVEALGYTVPDVLTWDYIWEVSEAAMAKDDDGNFKVNGQNVMIPFIYKSTDNMMIQYVKQVGAGYSDANGNIYLFNDDVKEFLTEIAKHARTRSFSTFAISSYPGNFLNAGQCIFAIDSTAGATWMGSDAPLSDIHESAKVQFETVVRMIPQADPENPQMISQGPSVCIFNKEDDQEVLASWLFAQFLLTNEVQIAYSSTEGYVPVTLKAQQSAQYQEYLSLEGADEDHYAVKIQAAKLLLDNTENTFVTPVFNGSASLRSAAGQLIEATTLAERRKTVTDDAYFENLFEETAALYHLDQIETTEGSSRDLGALPGASVALITVLIVVWVLIGAYFVFSLIRTKKKPK